MVTKFLAWQAAIVREYANETQFITQNFDFAWVGHSFGLQPEVNQREAAKPLTIAGVDIYHPGADQLTGAEIAMGGALGRSIKKDNYLVLETQAQGNPGWLPYPGQLRLQAYSHLSVGAASVMYWHWHSIHHSMETYWKGVLSHDLKENATYREVSQIGNELKKYSPHLTGFLPESRAAILVCNDALTALSYFPIGKDLSLNHVMRWLFDTLYEMNLSCDFIYPEDVEALSADQLLTKYDLVLFPSLYSMKPSLSAKLDAYVKEGGHLIGTFRSAVSDEYAGVYPDMLPYGLTDCFGMTYDQFTIPGKNVFLKAGEIASYADALAKKIPAKTAYAKEFMELLRPNEGTENLLTYDHPAYLSYSAATYHTYGKGSAAYIGCYFEREFLKELLKTILEKMRISLPLCEFPVICKKGKNRLGETLIYVLNYKGEEISFSLSDYLDQAKFKEATFTSLFKDKCVTLTDKVTLAPYDVQIFFIS